MTAIIHNLVRNAPRPKLPKFASRCIHLVDIENLVGEPRLTKQAVESARTRYLAEVLVGPMDQVVVATSSSQNLMAAAQGWPGARYLEKDGKDGADIRLAEVMCSENLESRFDTAVIASGDGGLAPFVSRLASRGMKTIAVSNSRSLSRQMRLASHMSIVFEPERELIA